MSYTYVCRSVLADCVNPDSYGIICVGCNQCGRMNEDGLSGTYQGFARQIEINPEVWHPWVQYGSGEASPIYYRLCPICGRFVKADGYSGLPEYVKENATCAVHGRVKMPFACWASELEEA